jgi:hypothetical protein
MGTDKREQIARMQEIASSKKPFMVSTFSKKRYNVSPET